MKRLCILFAVILILSSCEKNTQGFAGSFTAFTSLYQLNGRGYSYNDFEKVYNSVRSLMEELHRLFDAYNDYEGVSNVKTINDAAGIEPVAVDSPLVDLIEYCIDAYYMTEGVFNVALGPVSGVWNEYGEGNVPPLYAYVGRKALCGIEDIVVDREAGTIFLMKKGMSLDLEIIAPAYALELARELLPGGYSLSGGGHTVVSGAPSLERELWEIGIPDFDFEGNYIQYISVASGGVSSFGAESGFILDPSTLRRPERFRSVTVFNEEPLLCGMLSACLYALPYEEGKKLVDSFGCEAVWIEQ